VLAGTPNTYHTAGVRRGTASSNFHTARDNPIQCVAEGALEGFVARLATAERSDVDALVADFVASIQTDVDDLFVLVVDDLNILENAQRSLAVLDLIAQSTPLSMRLVLLTRSWTMIPSLPRLTAQRRAFTLTVRDLQFTDAEAVEFLNAIGLTDNPAQRGVVRRADGWAAALAILAEHHDPARGEDLDSASEFILADFIDQEVLSRLDDPEMTLLESCAILQTFDVSLIRDLSGQRDAGRRLRDLERATHLIVRLGSADWYRVHAILRGHLVDRLERDDYARLTELRRSAAALFARRGMRREAVEMALDAGDWSEAVEEIRDLREELYQHGEWLTLVQWLERLPAEIIEADPDLALTRARHAMKFFEGRDGLARIDSIDDRRLSVEQRARREVYRSVALRQIGRVSEALDSCRRARALALEALPEDDRLFAELDLEEGVALGISGRFPAAAERFSRAAGRFEQLNDQHRTAEAHDGLGGCLIHAAKLPDAMHAFTTAQRIWQLVSDVRHQLVTMINMGEVQRLLGDLETARDTLNIVIQRSRDLRFSRGEAYGHLNLAAIEHQIGHLDAAASLYGIAMEDADHFEDSTLVAAATHGLGMVYREKGDRIRARSLLEHGLHSSEQAGMLSYRLAFRTGLAAVTIDEGNYADAITQLEEAKSDAIDVAAPRETALLHFRMAAALLKSRRRARAMSELAQIPDIIAEIGYDGFLLIDARQFSDLVELAAARRIGKGYFARLAEKVAPLQTAVTTLDAQFKDSPEILRAEIFGTPRVIWHGRQISDLEWRSERSKEMFFFLLHSGKSLRKEQIAVELWPDVAQDRVNSAFHSTLYRLRKAIDREVVLQADDGYRVNEAFEISYDAREFEEHMASARNSQPDSPDWSEELAAAIRLYRGPFAEPFESEWVHGARQDFEDRYVSSLVALAGHALKRNDHRAVLSLTESIRNVDPLSEEAVRFEMRAYSRNGHLELATRAYRRHSDALRDIGDAPSHELRDEYERVLSGASLES
ncbi:MAG: BTAD domain-containing putative transcriptional regulator, partial [Chloroflexi bacterium]|nr:BTAD domain-containing putative transcriptional regulator [Chloroflexota bacterium]